MNPALKSLLVDKLARITAIAVARDPQDLETARLVAECFVAMLLDPGASTTTQAAIMAPTVNAIRYSIRIFVLSAID